MYYLFLYIHQSLIIENILADRAVEVISHRNSGMRSKNTLHPLNYSSLRAESALRFYVPPCPCHIRSRSFVLPQRLEPTPTDHECTVCLRYTKVESELKLDHTAGNTLRTYTNGRDRDSNRYACTFQVMPVFVRP